MQLTDLTFSLSPFLLTVAMVTDWPIGLFRKARTWSHFLKCSIYYDSNKKNNNRQKDRHYKSTHKSSPSLTWWTEFTACPSLLPTAITAIDCCQFELMSPDHPPTPPPLTWVAVAAHDHLPVCEAARVLWPWGGSLDRDGNSCLCLHCTASRVRYEHLQWWNGCYANSKNNFYMFVMWLGSLLWYVSLNNQKKKK